MNNGGWIWLVPVRAHESFIKGLDYPKIAQQILESRIPPDFPDAKEFVDVQSGVDYVLPDTIECTVLKEEIERRANDVLGELYLADIWCGILEKGQSTPYHRHSSNAHLYPEEYWSGVIYIDAVGPGCRLCLYADAMNAYNMVTKIEPETGKIVFFNSFVPHQTERHNEDRPRVCVSFNLYPKNPTTTIYPDMSPWARRKIEELG
jgi:hypothetical protein